MISKAKALLGTRRRVALAAGLALLATLALGVAVASATAPTVTTDDASSVSYTTAHVSGTVDPADQDTSFHFEYATQADFSDATSTPDQGPLSAGSGSQSVSDDLSGLTPNTTYHLRLVATNVDGTTSVEAPDTFTTLAVTPPTAAIDPVTGVTSSSAHFSGTVNPNAPGPAPQDPAFDANWHFDCVPGCPGPVGGTVPADNTPNPVSDDATGLEPNTDYTVTLHATNLGGEGTDQVAFHTDAAPPVVAIDTFHGLTTTTANLQGSVNPRNANVTDCRFEFSTDTSFSSSVPCDPAPGSGEGSVQVTGALTGLSPGTVYHYRLVATNAGGTSTVDGPDFSTLETPSNPACPNAAFRTGPSAGLPDCRAYEQVSPVDKNGGDILANSARTRVAADGDAVAFPSLAAFGDAAGTGVATDYLARRSTDPSPGTNGWATHAITPPQGSLTLAAATRGLDPLYEGSFSPDLDSGVFRAFSEIRNTPFAPNVSTVENLYLRTDLLAPGAGSYQLLSDAFAPVGSSTNSILDSFQPRLAGTSADFGHVIFESRYQLTPDAPAGFGPKLFEWDHGALRLAGVLPDGSPAPASVAGAGAFARTYTPHTISADGRRIFFTDFNSGRLYMRLDGASTVELSASERTDCAGDPTCGGDGLPDPAPDPGGAQPATYWDASADGSRVFFTSPEALTDDAPLNGDNKLYMYDTATPDSDPHNLTLLSVDSQPDDGADVRGVIGASADGRYVYFAAAGQLVAGLPSPSSLGPLYGVYLWHDGAVSYIGGVYVNNVALNASQDFQDDPVESRVAPDGRHLVFISTNGVGLTGYDHGTCGSNLPGSGCRELYAYSAPDRHLSCLSCNPSGAPATADASTQARAHGGGSSTTPAFNRALSDDGRYAFFTTGEALVPQDTNGRLDAYEYDTRTGAVHLLSTGTDPFDSYFMGTSAGGDDAFILTRQRLVGWDTDTAYDLYDVRSGGGFPAPPPPPPACVVEECKGNPSGTPSDPASGSSGFSGPGNQGTSHSSPTTAQKKKCKKGHNKKCKKSRKPRKGSARTVSTIRRTGR